MGMLKKMFWTGIGIGAFTMWKNRHDKKLAREDKKVARKMKTAS